MPEDNEDAQGLENSVSKGEKSWQYPHKFSCWEEVEKAIGVKLAYDCGTQTFTFNYDGGVNCAPRFGVVKGLDLDFAKAAFGTKAGSNKEFRPNDGEMALILGYAPRKDYEKTAFKVYYHYGADDQLDRHSTHFSTRGLKQQAALAPDQPWLRDHNYRNSDGVIGKIFDAKVVKGEDGITRLFLKAYVLDNTENKSVIDGIESGINNKLSVGIRVASKDFICDACNEPFFGKSYDWCGHYPGWEMENGETCTGTINGAMDFLEISRVTVPAQKYAAVKDVAKAADADEDDMKEKEDKKLATKSVEPALVLSKAGDFVQSIKDMVGSVELTQEKSDTDATADTIPVDSKKSTGETTVPEDETQKKADAAATVVTQAADNVITVQSFSQVAEQLQAISKSSESQVAVLVTLAEDLKKSNDEARQSNEDLKKAYADLQKANTERVDALEKQVEETKEAFSVIALAHKDLAQKCNALLGKSMEQLEQTLAHVKLAKQDRLSAEKQKQAEAEQAWTGTADRFF